jgi:hypothetical protein
MVGRTLSRGVVYLGDQLSTRSTDNRYRWELHMDTAHLPLKSRMTIRDIAWPRTSSHFPLSLAIA